MFKPGKKFGPEFILPFFLALGIVFGLVNIIINIPDYFESLSIKVTYPSSFDFKIYNALLRKHVRYGLVDYQSIKLDPDLKRCYEQLKSIDPDQLQGKLEKLSFWINTYNFLTIKCIADAYPIEQLAQESSRQHFVIGGKIYTLNQIKTDIFPPLINTSDWRAIFLICAGNISSPFIANHSYTASNLCDELDIAMKKFVLSPANFSYNRETKTFSISPFYRSNISYIDKEFSSPFDMVNETLAPDKRVNLKDNNRDYALPYDWRINDVAWLKLLKKKS